MIPEKKTLKTPANSSDKFQTIKHEVFYTVAIPTLHTLFVDSSAPFY